MNTWKKHKAILLPSRNGGRIGYNHTRLSENKLYYYHQGAVHSEAKHLHILSNEVPEIVNTPIYVEGVGIGRLTEEHGELCAYVPGGDGIGSMTFPFPRNFKSKVKMVIASTDKSLGLLGIPGSFLKEFCERGGVDEVMVGYLESGHLAGAFGEISIKPVKETWTRDEVKQLFNKFYATAFIDPGTTGEMFNKWIEENI